jgi:hypothetical protein
MAFSRVKIKIKMKNSLETGPQNSKNQEKNVAKFSYLVNFFNFSDFFSILLHFSPYRTFK